MTATAPPDLAPRCPLHHTPLHDWDGTEGVCKRRSRHGHRVTEPEWGAPPLPGHQRGGPGQAFSPGHAPSGRGFPAQYGPVRHVAFTPDQETHAETMAAATGTDRAGALRELVHLGCLALAAGAQLPDGCNRTSVPGRPYRDVRLHKQDDALVEGLRAPGRTRGTLHRQLVALGITARKRKRKQ